MSRLPLLLTLLVALFSVHAVGCDSADGEPLRVGANVVRVPAGYDLRDATVLARPGGGEPVVVEAERAGPLDAYFSVEGVPGEPLDLDLYDAVGGHGDRPVRLRQVPSGDRTRLVLSMPDASPTTVEYVSGGRVAWVASYAASDTLSLGDSYELVESVHYMEKDGKILIVYDFSDGKPGPVTTPDGEVVESCSEVRVWPGGEPARFGRPALEIGGAGWRTVRVEDRAGRE